MEEVADEDGNFDETEFLAAFNVLQSSGMLPETTSAEVVEVFDYVLEQYNQDAAEPAESIPSIALFVVMKDVVGEAWTKFIEQVEAWAYKKFWRSGCPEVEDADEGHEGTGASGDDANRRVAGDGGSA